MQRISKLFCCANRFCICVFKLKQQYQTQRLLTTKHNNMKNFTFVRTIVRKSLGAVFLLSATFAFYSTVNAQTQDPVHVTISGGANDNQTVVKTNTNAQVVEKILAQFTNTSDAPETITVTGYFNFKVKNSFSVSSETHYYGYVGTSLSVGQKILNNTYSTATGNGNTRTYKKVTINTMTATLDPGQSLFVWLAGGSNYPYYLGEYSFTGTGDVINNESNQPLAVDYKQDLALNAADNNVTLNWITATEINNKGFEVQRSNDGKTWTSLDFVASKAPNGNSTTPISYSYSDLLPDQGINYYRLRQINLDNNVTFNSKTVSYNNNQNSELSIYPNPVRSGEHIKVRGAATRATYRILSVSGAQVINPTPLNNNTIDVSTLAAGIYFLQIQTNNSSKTLKLIKK